MTINNNTIVHSIFLFFDYPKYAAIPRDLVRLFDIFFLLQEVFHHKEDKNHEFNFHEEDCKLFLRQKKEAINFGI